MSLPLSEQVVIVTGADEVLVRLLRLHSQSRAQR